MATIPQEIPHTPRKRRHPPKPSRIELAREFSELPLDALATRAQTAAWLNVSEGKLERAAWAGDGIPYIKDGRNVRYVKRTVLASLEDKTRTSTTDGA